MAIEFELTQSQSQIREMIRWFARHEMRPISLQADRDHAIPDDLLLKMKRSGISGGALSKREREEGGQKVGETHRMAVLAVEELAWGDPAAILSVPGPGLGGPPVRFMGTEAQKARFFAIFEEEEMSWGAYALTEPGAGSDVSGIRASCRKEGDQWVINGTKCFITNGARAAWVVCFATVDPSLGRAGHRAFVVERGTPGFRVGRIEEKMGLRASETAELIFENCRVPEENLLGGEDYYTRKEGFVGAMKTFDSTRPMVASMAVGIGRAALEIGQDFFKAHYMTGRPIARYRRIASALAQSQRELDAARLLCWRAAWMADHQMPNAREAAMSKAYAPPVAQRACRRALQLMAASGVTGDLLVEKLFRDVKVYDIFEGTGQIQRIVIAKRLIHNLGRF